MEEKRLVGDPYREITTYGMSILRSPLFLRLKDFQQHKHSNTYRHCLMVAVTALKIAKKKKMEIRVATMVKAALLHDYYLYDWHIKPHPKHHATGHPIRACENAKRDFGIDDETIEVMKTHMWPIVISRHPTSKEGWLLQRADKRAAIHEFLEFSRRKKKKKK